MSLRALRRLAWGLVAGACLLRLAHWGASVTGDEAYTLRNYAAGSVAQIRSIYNAPNNHVLLSLLLRGIDQSWPQDLVESMADPRPLQAPSVLASMGAVLLLYSCAALLAGPAAALIASAAFGAAYWHLLYSHMLRGYSLACFFNLLSLWLLLQALLRRRAWALWALPAAVAAGHYTLPSNALYTAALALWAAWVLRARKPSARTLKGKNAKAPPAPPPLSALSGLAVLAAAGGLTYWAYAPMWAELRAGSSASLPWGEAWRALLPRLREWASAAGRSPWFAWPFAAAALAGLWRAWNGGRRARRAALLCAAVLFVPLLASTALRTLVLPVRFYTAALPFWALALALGLRPAAAWAARRLPLMSPRRRLPLAWALAALAVLLAASGEVRAYLSWNRGLDTRRAVLELIGRAADEDDFAVIYTHTGDDGAATGELDWEYYAFAGNMEPHFYIHRLRMPAYYSPKRIFVLAEDAARARRAAADSRLDPWLTEALVEAGRQGRFGFYEAAVDAQVLAAYKRAARGPAGLARVQALTGLGAEALRRGDPAAAAAHLERAKAENPEDPRVRYQLGMARYLLFDDARAEGEFRWCVTRDTENVHAALYLGDALSQLGRFDEALRWYGWYGEPGHPAGVWMYRDRATLAVEAIRKGRGAVRNDFSSPAALERAAKDYFFRGSFERCQILVARAERLEPTFERQAGLAMTMGKQHLYAGAVRALKRFLKDRDVPEYRLFMARELMLKQRFTEARAVLKPLYDKDPKFEPVAKAWGELVRWTGEK